MCGTTCRPNLLDLEVNGRALKCIRDKLVSVYVTIISVKVLARGGMSKSIGGRGAHC